MCSVLCCFVSSPSLGTYDFDVSTFHEPPEDLRVRDLSEENLRAVKEELEIKDEVGSRLEIICVVPPVTRLIMDCYLC